MNFLNPDADVLDVVVEPVPVAVAVPVPVPVHADVPSPDTTYTVDLDLDLNLDLDFNLNFSVNSSVTFDCPMWTESDVFSKELTDSILTENFTYGDKETHLNHDHDTSFTGSEQLSSCNNDTIWNPFQGLDQFYYGDITDYDDTNTSAITTNTNDSDVFIFKVEPVVDAGIITNNSEQRLDVNIDSFFESYGFDVPKDSLFELDLFNECLKDVNETSAKSNVLECSNSVSTDLNSSVIDWNRRRSLLYDKNEFSRNASNAARRQEVVLRVKPQMCSSVSASKIRCTNTATIEQRTYKCSVRGCEKTYCKASHLKSHMRRHSGVKPFACDWDGCKWRFSRSDELARHKRSHSGIKPYTCNLCEKAFSRSDHLSKHAKVHMKKMAMYGTPIITKKCNYKYLSVNRIKVE